MKCRRCGSTDIELLVIDDMQAGKPRRSIRWFLFFLPLEKRISSRIETIAECQNCGYKWKTR